MRKYRVLCTINVVLYVVITLILSVCVWSNINFNVGVYEIIYTMTGSLAGTDTSSIVLAVKFCLPWIIGVLVAGITLSIIIGKKGKKQKQIKQINKLQRLLLRGAIIYLLGTLWYIEKSYQVIDYFVNRNQETQLYETYYVDPKSVEITPGETKRNLIYLYLESMETTYANQRKDEGINYMPNLTKLAEENVSFSNNKELGGMIPLKGTTWTMGAMFASQSGLPFSFPIQENDMQSLDSFASGTYMLGDFLKDQGYNQKFMCGSDDDFAGTSNMYKQHGAFDLFDLVYARQEGYIPRDYLVLWGFEDAKLFEFAKEEIVKLSKEDEPFCFNFITIDPHFPVGYVCQDCKDEYDDPTANVIACQDRKVNEFIEWCKTQDFYDNTTIVITGDHPRMDKCLVDGVNYYDRTIYNCIINSAKEIDREKTQKRKFSQLDMFPTILSAMGYTIEGEQLGLGVNMFSGKETLIEQLGLNYIEREIPKKSDYYVNTFAPEINNYKEGHIINIKYDTSEMKVDVYLDTQNEYETIYYSVDSITDGDHDIKWYSSSDAKSQWCVEIDLYDYTNIGDYVIQAYTSPVKINCLAEKHQRFYKLPDTRLDVQEEDNKVKVVYKSKTDIGKLHFAFWGDLEGQSDLIWYEPKHTNDVYQYEIDLSDHVESDRYKIHIYKGESEPEELVTATEFVKD